MTLEQDLAQFTGSVNFYRLPEHKTVFTEGVKYLVEQANLQSLLSTMEEIDENHPNEYYKFIKVTQNLNGTLNLAVYRDEDDLLGNYLVGYFTKPLPFENGSFDIWLIGGTILLPSEY
jgi:hypothetical protein